MAKTQMISCLQNSGKTGDPKQEKVDGYAAKLTPYIQMAGGAAQSAIDSTNNLNNLEYGSQSDAAKQTKNAAAGIVSSFNPVLGAAVTGVDAAFGTVGSALNKKNQYNKYGYNENENFGAFYMGLGGMFDPMSMNQRITEKGGEGSGLRALPGLLGFGGLSGGLQYKYEQKLAKEKEIEAEKIESSAWKLNQFNYNPIKDV